MTRYPNEQCKTFKRSTQDLFGCETAPSPIDSKLCTEEAVEGDLNILPFKSQTTKKKSVTFFFF